MPATASRMRLPSDLLIPAPLVTGTKNKRVRHIQEWLCLNGLNVSIDGDYGPATTMAVRTFQEANGLAGSGTVDQATLDALASAIHRVVLPVEVDGGLGELVVAYARQHLAQTPREIGGGNCGPWVRLYMDGREGPAWPWCAGFVSYVLRQAAAHLGRRPPFEPTYSCDVLAAQAKHADRFLHGDRLSEGDPKHLVPPGTIFLQRRTPGDWIHTGIVVRALDDSFETIEGNTNDSGHREGYEVCNRYRAYRKVDFALVGD